MAINMTENDYSRTNGFFLWFATNYVEKDKNAMFRIGFAEKRIEKLRDYKDVIIDSDIMLLGRVMNADIENYIEKYKMKGVDGTAKRDWSRLVGILKHNEIDEKEYLESNMLKDLNDLNDKLVASRFFEQATIKFGLPAKFFESTSK